MYEKIMQNCKEGSNNWNPANIILGPSIFTDSWNCKHKSDAIWELIALFLTNQIAGITIDFKMNVINSVTC